MKKTYPAIFYKENNSYWVEFPDLEGCLTNGETVELAFKNAKEALDLYLNREGDMYERSINEPSSFEEIKALNPEQIIMLVECDSSGFKNKFSVDDI